MTKIDSRPPDGQRAWVPVSPAKLVDRLAERIAAFTGIARVAVDGPPCARPHDLAERLVGPLRALGRSAHTVRADAFWRDASLRLEPGRRDPGAYADWLDVPALRREVLDAAVRAGTFLPSLRDPDTNRSTRAAARPIGPSEVLIVSGPFLLGRGLPFDLTVHLAVSPAARARRTPEPDAWTLPAFDRYDAEVRPAGTADMVIRYDHPDHPAVGTT